MKCAICKKTTSWDESFGHPSFIICPKCYKELNPKCDWETHLSLCKIGRLIMENKRKKE